MLCLIHAALADVKFFVQSSGVHITLDVAVDTANEGHSDPCLALTINNLLKGVFVWLLLVSPVLKPPEGTWRMSPLLRNKQQSNALLCFTYVWLGNLADCLPTLERLCNE